MRFVQPKNASDPMSTRTEDSEDGQGRETRDMHLRNVQVPTEVSLGERWTVRSLGHLKKVT